MGQSYILGCPEEGDAKLLRAVERVDTAMCKIRDAGKIKARDRIAVLAALNLSFDLDTPKVTEAPLDDERANHFRLNQILAKIDQVLGSDRQLI
jgi:cell division protein ZapA